MTTPRTPDRFRTELEDIGDTISKLKSLYPDAYDFGYSATGSSGFNKSSRQNPPSDGEDEDVGPHATGPPPSDPTGSAFAIRGRIRGLLRKANNRINAAIMALEEAHEALDDCFDQGPQLRPSMPERFVCKRCGKGEVKARGLCGTCLEYERRTGRGRPERLVQNG